MTTPNHATFAQLAGDTPAPTPAPNRATFEQLAGDTPAPTPAPDRATFARLADQWEQATRFISNISPFLDHPAYRQIIAMGPPAVPWLLARLDEGRPSHWFAALHELTGASPTPPESRGRIHEMTAAWQEWGRQQGYAWQADDNILGPAAPASPAPDRATFAQLADQWERERPRGLDLHFTIEHPAYQQIIAMGPPAVPWLLQRLAERPDHWFVALHRITGASPTPPESRGRIREMTAAWQEWGRQQGYAWQADDNLD